MKNLIDIKNEKAIELRAVALAKKWQSSEIFFPNNTSKAPAFYGYIEISVEKCPIFLMLSNNDDYVAKAYFWNGPNSYEPMSLKVWLALAKKSAAIFDVGAYTGLYGLAAAIQNRKAKIFSFEPIDIIYSRLLINKTVNNLGNLSAFNIALSDADGSAEINIYAGDTVLSTGSSLMENSSDRPVFVKKKINTITFDSFCKSMRMPRVDLIKIDAEGAEHLITKGAENTIRVFKPDIISEFLFRSKVEYFERFFRNLGYFFYRIDERKLEIRKVEEIQRSDNMNTLNTLLSQKNEQELYKLLNI
ncbi:MAG: FkbM family methyltransferase [Deltaproteobacteria bacterium]|nr:FkbM family methyltransferase [Deltaproteobacteria bacterium]